MDNDKKIEALKLHGAIEKHLNKLYNSSMQAFKIYLESITDNEPTPELQHFFFKEIENICSESEKTVDFFDLSYYFLQQDEETKQFTQHAVEMQKHLKAAYERALQRVESGEPIIEERATMPAPIQRSLLKAALNSKMLETISKRPEHYIFPNDKINNMLTGCSIDGEEQPIIELTTKTGKNVTSYITLDFDEAAKNTDLSEFTLNFNEFDKQVLDAVVSLMKAGNEIITAQQIYRTLIGNKDKRTTDTWIEDIRRSMRKFNSVRVTANLKDATKIYPKLKEIESIVSQERLMEFKQVTVKTKNGTEITAYQLFAYPILYTIADLKGLVGCFDIKLLENSKTTDSKENTELKIYLLKRINAMKHGMNTSILFDTLYKALDRQTEQNQRTTRANAEKLLLQFKADKIIKDFSIEKNGKKATRIIITIK